MPRVTAFGDHGATPPTDSYGTAIRVGDLMVLGVYDPCVGVVAEVIDGMVTLRDEMVPRRGREGAGVVWEVTESKPWSLTGVLPATAVVVDSVMVTGPPAVGDVVVSNADMLSVVTGVRPDGWADLWHLDLDCKGREHVSSCVVIGTLPWL